MGRLSEGAGQSSCARSSDTSLAILPERWGTLPGYRYYPRSYRREGCGSRRTLFYSTRIRLRAGLRVSHAWGSVRRSVMLGRYSSEIRTGCVMSARPGLCGGTGQLVSLPRSPTIASALLVAPDETEPTRAPWTLSAALDRQRKSAKLPLRNPL